MFQVGDRRLLIAHLGAGCVKYVNALAKEGAAMTNVLGQINNLSHLAKHNRHYSLINFHFSTENDSV